MSEGGPVGEVGEIEVEGQEVRFPIEVEGFRGSLEELVLRAQRGDLDLAALPVATITAEYRRRLSGGGSDPREIADFLALASRLVGLKARQLLPDGPIEAVLESAEDAPIDDAGARLAEYRLFRAAADALLAEAAEEGMRSFLGLVSAEVVPAERLSIPPERLAAAFRRVLERLPEPESLALDTITFSVEDKISELRQLLERRRAIGFEEVFERAVSRLEAVACFLALLELMRLGGARVEQASPFGEISVRALG